MDSIYKKQYYVDSAGLISIGIFSFGYVLFKAIFAEFYIQLSFLNFPIFLGEILIFLCLMLLTLKYILKPWKMNIWSYFILAYFVFVLIKALLGYKQWGPLAFRHAAMLYYPIFVIFGYYFYRRDFFDSKKSLIISLIIICMLASYVLFNFRVFNAWWIFTSFVLVLILMRSNSSKISKYVIFGLLFLSTPYKYLLIVSRMMIISNIIAIACAMTLIYIIMRTSKKAKILIAVVTLFFISVCTVKFASDYKIRSIFNMKEIVANFNWFNELIEEKKYTYQMAELGEVRLFNPNFEVDRKDRFQHDGSGYKTIEIDGLLLETDKVFEKPIGKQYRAIDSELYEIMQPLRVIYEKIKNDPKHAEGEFESSKKEFKKLDTRLRLIQIDDRASTEDRKKIAQVLKLHENLERTYATRSKKRAYNNAIFRLLIWRDMINELILEKPFFGISLGKPLRSISLEVLRLGYTEWSRDGWIAAHNSYLHIIYRAGVIGVVFILAIIIVWLRMVYSFIKIKSITGILLTAAILNWFVAANFLLIFELPYTAIPIWSLYGMTLAYCHSKTGKNKLLQEKKDLK